MQKILALLIFIICILNFSVYGEDKDSEKECSADFSYDTIKRDENSVIVKFTVSNSDTSASYRWSYGDGKGTKKMNPTHVYKFKGKKTFTVKLRVTSESCMDQKVKKITLETSEPEVIKESCSPDFTYEIILSDNTSAIVQFTSSMEDADIYTWNFGDGSISNDKKPLHTFNFKKGLRFTVTLNVKKGSCYDSKAETLTFEDVHEEEEVVETVPVEEEEEEVAETVPVEKEEEEDYASLFEDIQSDDTISEDININIEKFSLNLLAEHTFIYSLPVIEEYFDFYDKKNLGLDHVLGFEIKENDLKFTSNWNVKMIMNDQGDIDEIIDLLPLDNYISWEFYSFIFNFGYQTYNWGKADNINPTNNLNPRDYNCGFPFTLIPALSIDANFYPFNWLSMSCVYIPFEQSDEFGSSFEEDFISQFPGVDIDFTQYDFDPNFFVLGGKLDFYFPMLDFSLSYLYDLDSFYTPDITLVPVDISVSLGLPPGTVIIYNLDQIELYRDRIHRFGFDFKTIIGRLGIWGEVGYYLTTDYDLEDYKIRNHKLSWVTGLDFNFGPNNDFYFNFQYIGEFIPSYDNSFYDDYEDGMPSSEQATDEDEMEEFYYRLMVDKLGNMNEGFLQGVSLTTEWPLFDYKLTPTLTATYFFPLIYNNEDVIKKLGGIILNPKLDFMPVDSFHIYLGANLYYSWYKEDGNDDVQINENDFIGRNYKNNRVYIEILYKWGYELKK